MGVNPTGSSRVFIGVNVIGTGLKIRLQACDNRVALRVHKEPVSYPRETTVNFEACISEQSNKERQGKRNLTLASSSTQRDNKPFGAQAGETPLGVLAGAQGANLCLFHALVNI